jgi:nuclear receptor coactivator 2
MQHRHNEETILKGLGIGFPNPSPPSDDPSRSRKRPSEDGGDVNVPPKKMPAVLDSIPPPPQPAVVATRSNLQERNKMLAQLLAKQPSAPAIIPHVPPSIISATPQDRLPKFSVSGGGGSRSAQGLCIVHLEHLFFLQHPLTIIMFLTDLPAGALPPHVQQGQMRVSSHPQRPPAPFTCHVLNDLLQQQQQQPQHPQPGQTPQQLLQRHRNSGNKILWDSNAGPYYESPQTTDPDLQDILDQLFANVPPDAVITATDLMEALQPASEGSGISNTAEISAGVSNVTLNNPADNSDQEAAINAITRSFMQCEQSTNIKRMQGVSGSIFARDARIITLLNLRLNLQLPQQLMLQQHLAQQQAQQQPSSQQQLQSPQPGQPSGPMQPAGTLNQVGQPQQPFQTSTMYAQRARTRVVMHQNMAAQISGRPMAAGAQYAVGPASNAPPPPFAVQGQPNMMNASNLISHQKRLLHRQSQQQLLIPSNATANSQSAVNLQSMDLLNGGPPNVSLQVGCDRAPPSTFSHTMWWVPKAAFSFVFQRSTSLSSDSPNAQQLSPGGNPAFGSTMLSSPQISPSQRQQSTSLPSPYSPLGTNHQQQSFTNLK